MGFKRKRTESRHFRVCSPKRSPTLQQSPLSQHFLLSPSSAWGSIHNAMNSGMSALIAPRSCSDTHAGEIDSTEWRIHQATDQFSDCGLFMKAFRKCGHQSTGPSQACNEEDAFERIMECTRHLCTSACYLRAFAPRREWMYLQNAVSQLASKSPGSVLQGWTVHLLSNEKGNTKANVIFVSPSGNRFDSKVKALRSLDLTENGSRIHDGTILDATIRTIEKQKRIDLDLNLDMLCGRTRMGRFRKPIPQPQEDMIQLTTSPFGLLEELFPEDPWKLLLSAILLNRTSRVQVDVTLFRFLQKWPNAESTAAADWEEISKLIAPLGIRNRRAKGLIRFSKEYLDLVGRKRKNDCTGKNWEFDLSRNEILGLYYCGEYAAQVYRIFIQKRLVQMTCDHALQAYVDYKRGSQSIGHVAL